MMAANVFDQFDKPAASGGNAFDQLEATRQQDIAKKAAAESMAPEQTVIPGLHVARAVQAAGDLARVGIGQGLGLGFGDETMAALQSLSGTPYTEALRQQQDALTESKARMNAQTPGSAAFMEIAPSLAYGGGKTLGSAALKGYGLGTASSVGHGETDPLKVLGAGAVGAAAGAGGSALGNLPNIAKAAAGPTGYGLGQIGKRPLDLLGFFYGGIPGYIKGLAVKEGAKAAAPILNNFSVGPSMDTSAARDLFARLLTAGGRQLTDRSQ